jgi:hypothetical protein
MATKRKPHSSRNKGSTRTAGLKAAKAPGAVSPKRATAVRGKAAKSGRRAAASATAPLTKVGKLIRKAAQTVSETARKAASKVRRAAQKKLATRSVPPRRLRKPATADSAGVQPVPAAPVLRAIPVPVIQRAPKPVPPSALSMSIPAEHEPEHFNSKRPSRIGGHDEREIDEQLLIDLTASRFSDEDRYTNRTGDPRIGTHRRVH